MNIDIISPSSYSEGKIYAISPSTLDLNFTRASTKTRIDENGYIDNVPYNIISYSEEFENGYWTKGGGTTITPNVINSPYGTLTADKIEQTGSAVLLTKGGITVKSGPVTLSCYIKKGNFDSNGNFRFGFFNSGSIGFITYNFLTNQTSVVSGTVDKHGVIQEEDGWVRVYITCTLNLTQAINLSIYFGGSGANIGTGNFYYLWGAQLTSSSDLLPYIKTTTRQNVPSINYINNIPSIQLEPQRTNLLTQSETFTDASWVKLNSLTVSSGTTISPNGSSNASTLVTANSTSIQGIYKDVSGLLTATRYSFSSFVKKKDYDFAYIKFDNLNGVFANDIVYFNLTGGTVATRDPDIVASVETFRDGWYRIEATRLSLTGGTGRVTLGLASADNTETIAGDGVKGTYVWGAQLEAGPYTSSYIPTISSTATRLADNFSKSNLLSNNLIYSSGGTWFFEVVDNFVYSGNTETLQLILGSNASGTNNSIALSSSANNRYKFVKYQASGKTDLFQTTTDDFKAAVRWNATSFDVFVNGLKVVTGTTFDSSTLEFLNSNMTDVPLNIKNISFSNQYYSDDVLTKATTRQQKLLLDTYPDAAAAFSLRKLKSSYTGPLVKVRRSSDNLEQDIFPTSDGDLDVVALRSFVGTENLLLYSEEFSQTNWVKSGSGVGLVPIVTANTAVAPDGTLTADTVLLQNTGTTTSDWSYVYQTYTQTIAGANYTFSVWLKAATPDDIGKQIRLALAGGVNINLTNDWVRYSFSIVASAGQLISGVRIRGTEVTTTSVSLHMWGAQLSQTSTVIDYNKTTVGQGGNGFVTTWYDQSGLGNNAVQTTAANQPQIVASGNVLLQNNKPCIIFDDVNDTLRSPVDFATNTSIFSTFRCNDTVGVIYSGTDIGNDFIYAFRVNSGSIAGGLTISQTYKNGNLLTLSNQTSVLNEINTSQVLIWSSLLTNVTLSRFSNLQIGTGVLGATAINWSEIIIYPNNQFSNRTNIESNINRYYNVYDDLPAWNKSDYSTTDSNAFVSYISRNLNKPQVQVTNTFGNLIGSSKWAGGVLAPNGKIYGIPFNSTTVLEIDPITQTTAAFGNLIGSVKWGAGVLAPNGKIYGIPLSATSILEIDPITQTTATIGNLEANTKWYGAVLGQNGKIYGIPYNSATILEFDPVTQIASTFGNLSGSSKYIGGVLGPNGKIYGIPFGSSSVLEIDPITQTTTTFGDLSGSNRWAGGVLGPNGKIYGIPFNSTSVLEIDPITQTITTFGNLSGDSKWRGGVLAPNGKIYGIPNISNSILEIDVENKTTTFIGNNFNTSWFGCSLGLNGKIYGIPYNSTTILEILTQPSELNINVPLSRHLNKF